MKNPQTPAGIEPATFRFVAQHLNHVTFQNIIIVIAKHHCERLENVMAILLFLLSLNFLVLPLLSKFSVSTAEKSIVHVYLH